MAGGGLGWAGVPALATAAGPSETGLRQHPLILIAPSVGFFAWAEAVFFQAYCGENHLMKNTPGPAQRAVTATLGTSGFN